MIDQVTPEQTALIPIYREKWRQIVATERIDRQRAIEAVRTTYSVNGFPEPEIFVCDSPFGNQLKARSLMMKKPII